MACIFSFEWFVSRLSVLRSTQAWRLSVFTTDTHSTRGEVSRGVEEGGTN
ncbi:hypothetical protein HMPREF1556_00446 [Porphyromonas sp. oral taxon 278 str. W7784]|nr:hypothetical protein HMPREF1556_00446 [Porphyromonas sp. oral taxon 278 str. W7784]